MLEELCASCIVDRHQVTVVPVSMPHTGSGSDERNYHAPYLMSTLEAPRKVYRENRELDQKHSGGIEHCSRVFSVKPSG
jgi:hypothetical protein